MITMMLAQVFIQAGILCLILFLIARYEADYSFAKVAMVTAGCVAGSVVLEALLVQHIGHFTIIPVIVLITAMIMKFCWITLWKSSLVVVVFIASHVGFAMFSSYIQSRVDNSIVAASPVDEEDMQLALEFNRQVGATLSGEKAQLNTPHPGETAQPALSPATPPPASAVSSNRWNAARSSLKIGGTARGRDNVRFALCNGRPIKAGDTVRAVHEQHLFLWHVKSVTTSGVDLEPLDARKIAPAQ